MARYFLEVAYKGTAYSGFQTQQNANTIQAELEKAFKILHKDSVEMTGSSRTDAGVHAKQNYLHFDYNGLINSQFIYKFNAILPSDIVAKRIILVNETDHCRFDAINREYRYYIYQEKDPFLQDRAFYFPYKLDIEKMNKAAELLINYTDFTSFSKRNTQAKTFECNITVSQWYFQGKCLVYNVQANRFLRGMVRALTATMLRLGRNKITIEDFIEIIKAKDCTKATFSVPAHGLFLEEVEYPMQFFK